MQAQSMKYLFTLIVDTGVTSMVYSYFLLQDYRLIIFEQSVDVAAEARQEGEDEVEDGVVSVGGAAIEVEATDVGDLVAEVAVTEADGAEDEALAEDVGVVVVGGPEVVEASEGHSNTLLLAQFVIYRSRTFPSGVMTLILRIHG